MSPLLEHLLPAPVQRQQNPPPHQVCLHCKRIYHYFATFCPCFVLDLDSRAASFISISSVTGSKSTSAGEFTVYVDLAYIPSGASSLTVNMDFFRCVRSSCYIISGDNPEREELLRQTLDALLESKASWPETMQVETRTPSQIYALKQFILFT